MSSTGRVSSTGRSGTTTVTDVAVFDGHRLLDGRHDVTFGPDGVRAVVPTGSRPVEQVGADDAGDADDADDVVDGRGGTLLPGLIDAHVHLRAEAELDALARFGVTTAVELGQWSPQLVAQLHAAATGADFRTSGGAFAGPDGVHSRIPGFPPENLVRTPEDARAGVERRVAEGVDYIKLLLEGPGYGGPDVATAATAVEVAHAHDRMVVAHAAFTGAVDVAVQAGVDVLTHAPLNAPLAPAVVEQVVAAREVIVPTLTMMQATAANRGVRALSYEHARDTVRSLHAAGVPVIAGTDANDLPGVPASIPHGSGLHDELLLLTEAGLTPLEALRAATSTAAEHFGLHDRGRVGEHLRSDLVLVTGDPTTRIAATRDIRAVWTAGRVVQPAPAGA